MLVQGLYDHCHVLLTVDEDNWGSKSEGMLKCWTNFLVYKKLGLISDVILMWMVGVGMYYKRSSN